MATDRIQREAIRIVSLARDLEWQALSAKQDRLLDDGYFDEADEVGEQMADHVMTVIAQEVDKHSDADRDAVMVAVNMYLARITGACY